MTETPELSIYEKPFVQSDKTDAIMFVEKMENDYSHPSKKIRKLNVGDNVNTVQGTKLYVNKALLSYHSDYFNTLFNGDFKEKSMEEIPIKDVNFEDFATVLSLILNDPIPFSDSNVENLLELAERFQLPAVKRHLEIVAISSSIGRDTKLRIADKFKLNELLTHVLSLFSSRRDFQVCNRFDTYYRPIEILKTLSDDTNVRLYTRAIEAFSEAGY